MKNTNSALIEIFGVRIPRAREKGPLSGRGWQHQGLQLACTYAGTMQLEKFNAASPAEAVDFLRPCLDIPRWLDELAARRPYSSLADLLAAGRDAANPFTPAEIDQALSHHPRIGERASGSSAEARLSAAEQAGLGESGAAVAKALAEGNRTYEEKFGRVFLIRAAGRSRAEILAALTARLAHTADEEQTIIGQQLREIAVLRLEGLIST
jgi:2-oxo-4-hydroxy-4-carboxy-5-ureidoimidazoline decarboxylase